MNEITVEQLYDFMKEKYKNLFDENYIKDKQFKSILDEIFQEAILSYVRVLVLFQITDDVIINFRSNTKNSAELKQIDLFLHYFSKIIDKHNLIIKDLRIMNMKIKY